MAEHPVLSPAEKAAVLLIALGEDLAAFLFRAMEPREVRAIAAAINRLGKLEQSTIDTVLQEFHSILTLKQSDHLKVPTNFVQNALKLAFKGEKGIKLAQQIGKSAVKLRCLELYDAPTLVRVLDKEQPQTIAMVLAHASSSKAVQVLKLLPQTLQTEILMRLAKLSAIDPNLIAEIDQQLLEAIDKMGSMQQRNLGGSKKAAAILNHMEDKGIEILAQISSLNPSLSLEIRQGMFGFEDLIYLDNRGLQELLKNLPPKVLTLALRGVEAGLQQLFLRNMSERAAQCLLDDIEALGKQKTSDIQKAQQMILAEVQKLEAMGKLVIDRDNRQAS